MKTEAFPNGDKMSSNKLIRIYKTDNVAVAVSELDAGQTVSFEGGSITANERVPFGHKLALTDIAEGGQVIKYGNVVGHASKPIKKGDWVHSHNMATNLSGIIDYQFHGDYPWEREEGTETFDGYVRADGRVGIRNEIWIIPTVSCVNHTARVLAEKANAAFGSECDGIFALPHNTGCSQMGEDQEISRKLLANIIRHPNAGGVLVLSLGCENSNWSVLEPYLKEYDKNRIRIIITQEVEGDEIEKGMEILKELADIASGDRRQPVPVSRLKIGFKCGGSDAFSGISANPLCGSIAEHVTKQGGIGVLTEVPEMFGAETSLMDRAADRQVFDKIVKLIDDFKEYYIGYGQPVYDNPAPGNKEGGITTLEEKSSGCIQKGGMSQVTDTVTYGGEAAVPGLNLMNGPGNDNVSITNLVSCGVQMILFTTGRGNPLGSAVPTLKIASNSRLYERKKHWFDFNAGTIIEGEDREEAAKRLWKLIIDVASGRQRTRCEENGFKEIMIFKNGAIL